ncbi:Thymidylate synthase 1 [compost metagenome]
MGKYDVQYAEMVNRIITEGIWDKGQDVRTVWVSDGTPAYTKSLVSHNIKLDNSEVPLLTTKYVPVISSILELLWFYVERTSDATFLRENGVKYWDDWIREDGTIGKAYGYQLGKPILGTPQNDPYYSMINTAHWNQVEKLLYELSNNPASRRHIISLWNIDDLWDMALPPCMWNHQCIVLDGKLHMVVQIRSNDTALGNPVNVFQMYVWQRMLCQITGLEMGTLEFNINIPHIYERHITDIQKQVQRVAFTPPKLWINPAIKKLDDFTINDFLLVSPDIPEDFIKSATREEIEKYKYYKHQDKIYYEIAK